MLLSKKLGLITLAALSLVAYAATAQVRADGAQLDDVLEPTLQENLQYMQSRNSSLNDVFDNSGDFARIRNYDPSSSTGRIIIRVHKSENGSRTEYLEVFRQRSSDPADIDPILLFDDGTSNRALVSTGGVGHTTPSGTFMIDFMERMHYSSAYNNAPMPNSIFFNGGIAIHATTPSAYARLGSRASHGCVRTHLKTSELLYDYVRNDGKQNVVIQVLDL